VDDGAVTDADPVARRKLAEGDDDVVAFRHRWASYRRATKFNRSGGRGVTLTSEKPQRPPLSAAQKVKR
jgi:hypothetical protein